MVGGGYLSITGVWSWTVAWASLPYAIGAFRLSSLENINKIPWDRPRGIEPYPQIHQWGRWTFGAWSGCSIYLLWVAYCLEGSLQWPVLLVLGSLPFLRKLVRFILNPLPAPRQTIHIACGLFDILPMVCSLSKIGLLYIVGLLISQWLP